MFETGSGTAETFLLKKIRKMAGRQKRVSTGLDFTSPQDITEALRIATEAK